MTQEEEFQRYATLVEYYKEQLQSIDQQFSYLQAAVMDFNKAKITIEKIGEAEEGADILVPIGGGTFSFAKAKDTKKILTEVGAGIVLEKNPEEAIKILDRRIEELQKNQETLSKMSKNIQQQLEEVSTKAQQLLSNRQ
ncbi:MAG: prefoldin subunit alpha [Thermoplasmatota archaeon]